MFRRSLGTWVCSYGWLVFPALYVAGYFVFLSPVKMYGGHGAFWVRTPNYRWDSRTFQCIFLPIHWVDKLARPRYWFGLNPGPGFKNQPAISTGEGFGGRGPSGRGFVGGIPDGE